MSVMKISFQDTIIHSISKYIAKIAQIKSFPNLKFHLSINSLFNFKNVKQGLLHLFRLVKIGPKYHSFKLWSKRTESESIS